MKQRITIEQINELTDEQKERLSKWWKPNIDDPFINQRGMKLFVYEIVEHVSGMQLRFVSAPITYPYQSHTEDGHSLIHKSRCLPVLSVAQMIELLGEKVTKLRKDSNDPELWDVVWDLPEDGTIACYSSQSNLLCDALWDVIKKGL